jgi:mRNA-degrading endonuclease RelE of RelBE toxin-antitoxin system
MSWKIIVSKTFSKDFRKYKKNGNFSDALEKKMLRIKKNPANIGGYLSGRLHGYKSTRIIRKLRLIFKIDEDNCSVFLVGIDHRKSDYRNF